MPSPNYVPDQDIVDGYGDEDRGIHPSEVYHYINTHRSSGLGAWMAGFIGSAILLVSMTVKDFPQRTFWQAMGMSVGIAGYVSYKMNVETMRINRDYRDASDQGRANRLVKMFAPKAQSLQLDFQGLNRDWYPSEKQLVNINELMNNPREYPTHILLFGATGRGKTTIMEYLLRLAKGMKLVITPKKEDNDFLGIPVIGVTHRNGKRYPYDHKAIGEGLGALWQEVYERNQLSTLQALQLPTIWAGVDEIPDITANVHNVYDHEGRRKSASETIMGIAAMGRTRRVRLIIATQDQGVKALDIEGRSGLRDNFSYIRLFNAAIDHCQMLINKGRLPKEAMVWLANQKIPAMYENIFIVFPDDIWDIRPDVYTTDQVVVSSSLDDPSLRYSSRGSSPERWNPDQKGDSVVSSSSRVGSDLDQKAAKTVAALVTKGTKITRYNVLKKMGMIRKDQQTPEVLIAVDSAIEAHQRANLDEIVDDESDDDDRIV